MNIVEEKQLLELALIGVLERRRQIVEQQDKIEARLSEITGNGNGATGPSVRVMQCKECGRLCGSPQGLSAHVRNAHPKKGAQRH